MRLRDKPCETCGWKFPGDHVCVDLSTPIPTRIQNKHNAMHNQAISPEHRQRLSDGLTERWRRHREENYNRDKKIVNAYKNGLGMKAIAREFGPHYHTIMGILHRAAARGEVEIRPKGHNAPGRAQ